jgi:hypothetical protein
MLILLGVVAWAILRSKTGSGARDLVATVEKAATSAGD